MKYQDFDYYEALGVDNSATTLEIKEAYRKIANEYHPDKAFKSDEQEKYRTLKQTSREGIELLESEKELLNKLEKKIEPFSKAAIAYGTLSDPNERKKYDGEKGIKKRGSVSDPGKRNGYGKKEKTKKSDQAPKMNTKKDIESELLEALHHKNLKQAKTLVEQLNHLGKLHRLSSMLDSFVQNACNCDDWFKFFEEILSYKKIDLENTFFYSTPLEHACHLNNTEVANLLLRNGANVNGTDFNQERVPIYHALKHNNCDLVNLLFKHGAKIDVNNKVEKKIIANSHLYNKTTMEALLKYTSPKQNTQIFKHLYLLRNEAPADKYQEIFTLLSDKGVNPFDARLYEAPYNQNLERARSLIADIENSSKCFTRDPENFGLLVEMACTNNDWFKFFEEVLSNKMIEVDLDVNIKRCKGTALQYACRLKKKDVAKLLLDNGADVNKVVNGRTAIFFATIRCKNSEEVELVKLLLNSGADPYLGEINISFISQKNEELKALLNQNDKSRLSEAFQSKNLEIVKRLGRQIYSSDDLLIQNHLYYFVKNSCENDDWFKFFKEVLSEQNSKIDLNIDHSGTALHYACNQKNKNVIELLLKHKANVNKVGDFDNKPPIYSLLMHNNHELAGLLCQSGAITASVIPEVEKAISDNSWHDKYSNETMKVIVGGAGSAEYRTIILKSFFNNKTLTARDIEIVKFLLSGYQNIDPHLDLMQTAINEGNNELIGLFDQILGLRLSENLMYKRFEKAKELIRKVKDLNKCKIKQHDLGHADDVLLLRYLVEKACSDNDWFKFFQEILSEQKSKMDLNLTIFPVHGTALNYARHKKNNDVENSLLKHGASNFCLGSPKAIFQVEQHVKENPSKKLQNDEQASQLEVLPAVLSVKSKKSVIASSALAITGIISGIAIAFYSGMLAVGIAVGACCLVVAAIIYYCNKLSKSLENSNAEDVVNQITVQNYNLR